MKLTRRCLAAHTAVAALGGELLEPLASKAAPESPSAQARKVVVLPPQMLHGYGRISATIHSSNSDGVSLATIECESAAKALLVQAKYLSDLQRLPGVKAAEHRLPHGGTARFWSTAAGQTACFARHNTVLILAANKREIPPSLFAQEPLNSATASEFHSRADVPMYLDRWDKYGLLCYFGPEVLPPGSDYVDQKWDYANGLNFARDNQLGLVPWTYPVNDDFFPGSSVQSWSWVQEAARRMNIPVHVNTQINPPQLWLANRYPEQTMLKAPQFLGGYYGVGHDSTGLSAISWLSQEAWDALLGVFQSDVKRFAADANIVGWLEPHGETYELPQKLFLDSGPYADKAFSDWLRHKYGSLQAVGHRWHDNPSRYTSWEQIRMPEVAAFAGFGKDAIDLQGDWRVKYLRARDGHTYTHDEARGLASPPPTAPIPPEWLQPDYDDSGWDLLFAPGNDRLLFIARSPLLYRRSITISPQWLNGHKSVSLYVWEIVGLRDDKTSLWVNGTPAPAETHGANDQRWTRFDITAAVKPGVNHLALLMPRAIICYRSYITHAEPVQYPHLGPHLNAQWEDFLQWNIDSRGAQIRRGAEMIRQVDPHRSINFMAATDYADPVRQACKDYGGRFHDTGSMAGFWTDENCLWMSGARLPVTAEPGNGAPNIRELQLFWGRWITEGVNGVHYFQNWGEIAWNPEVLAVFQANRVMYEAVGKYHAPFAQVGVLFSLQSQWLTGFPWDTGPAGVGGYYSGWNAAMHLLNLCPRDGVGALDFDGTDIDRYRVIVDTNSSVMDDHLIQGIERYCKRGGVFITYGQTGRSSPLEPDGWPITRLTRTHVVRANGPGGTVSPAPGQKVYRREPKNASGLRLQAVNSEPLLLWEDGTAAVCMRRLGSGYIIHFGMEVSGGDFVEWIKPLLTHFGATERPGASVTPQSGLHFRHFIGNTGLHDVWVVFNESDSPIAFDINFRADLHPANVIDIVTGEAQKIERNPSGDTIPGMELARWQTRMFVSARSDVAGSPLEWLTLQRGWHQGTQSPPAKRLPSPEELQRFSLDLTRGWAFKMAPGVDDDGAHRMLSPDFNDQTWERRTLGQYLYPGDHSQKRLLMRRTFTVPAHWPAASQIALFADIPYAQFFHETRIFIDGKPWAEGRKTVDGPYFDTVGGVFIPGSKHLIGLDIATKSTLIGSRGPIWLSCIPDVADEHRQDLAGEWVCWSDAIRRDGTAHLPGETKAMYLGRSVQIDANRQGRSVFVYCESEGDRLALIVNGHLIRHGDQPRQHLFIINITPLIRFGAENKIELAGNSNERKKVTRIELRYYAKAEYP